MRSPGNRSSRGPELRKQCVNVAFCSFIGQLRPQNRQQGHRSYGFAHLMGHAKWANELNPTNDVEVKPDTSTWA
ncbi:unnamed protein product [Protopolystoma xenopodis]|uniref:Uncharacterized protein n=1 Tax=Protopolystoma xenopodis TaxID=117903 RepID=A0A448XEU9_9PLAT|nr:unnamed protein product [Protopolystoma xenopodis]